MKGLVGLSVLLLGTGLSAQSPSGTAACERLATLVLPTGTITQAQTVQPEHLHHQGRPTKGQRFAHCPRSVASRRR